MYILYYITINFCYYFNYVVSEWSTVGQNVAAVWTYEHNEGPEMDFESQIESWFNEYAMHRFSPSTVESFRYAEVAGHYSQVRGR